MAETSALVELENVTKTYPTPGGEGLTVLDAVSLAVSGGESLAVVGPSGSGKSTLLNIIGTLDRPTTGRVWLDGRDLSDLGDDELAAVRSRRVGFVFQLHHLLPQCTALENVLVPALAGGGTVTGETEQRGKQLLARVGLADRMAYRPGHLSGGERQRVAVARALINQPALLLADEPTGSLDREASANLEQLLVEVNREEGVTLIVVTHASPLAAHMAQAMELRDGRLAPMEQTG
jgi:lipoprotein-releasing system ATP-binding protein